MTRDGGDSESPVPEAVGRVLGQLWERLGPEKVDRVWIFPPLVRGRKESGLVAASSFTGDPDQRILFTARYSAELTGQGIRFDSEVKVEGSAPPDHLARVMDGVVRRSVLQLADPKEVAIRGDAETFLSLARSHGWEGPPEPAEPPYDGTPGALQEEES